MKKYVFRVGVQVEPMEGTQLPEDCAGAYVNVYLGADEIREAIERVEIELLNDCYMPVLTYEAYQLDLEERDYDTDEEGYPGNADLIHLQENGGIWYGPFNLYPPEDIQLQ
ncbi:hypothetical protein [Candidatus Thiodiazotropha sp. LNASS1]|uniref:hypothetical protein n=1 Tax=Candidatus Thiodiazotropha sp. LNASS1 TaxID=3096260 RepID=UPI0034DFCFC2